MESVIKKVLLLSFCTSLALAGYFDSSDVWEDGTIECKEYTTIGAIIYVNGDNQMGVGITMPSDDCSSFESTAVETGGMYFNNTMVKMYAQCIGNGSRMDFPQSNAGINYINNEFSTKNIVVMKQDGYSFTFSTNGFIKEFNKEKEKVIAEANGI